METLNNNSPLRYAVIRLPHSDSSSEYFIIRYRKERDLRELLAKASIAAIGFASADEASAFGAANTNVGELRILSFAASWGNVVHIARATFHKMQFELTRALRRLQPAL
jgi:hypothetical protein